MGRRTAIIDYLDVSHIRTRYNYRSELDLWKPYEENDPDEPGGAIYPHYTFTYDPIGNRRTREATDSSGTIQKEYDANVLNQYESITNPAQSLAYDADGNLTDDGSWTYTWDGAGRLVKGEIQRSPTWAVCL